jgi:hypothetical protein
LIASQNDRGRIAPQIKSSDKRIVEVGVVGGCRGCIVVALVARVANDKVVVVENASLGGNVDEWIRA